MKAHRPSDSSPLVKPSGATAIAMLLLVLVAACSEAQPPGGNVSVQLPTFHQFGVSTTVIVPDQGSLSLGGVNRSSIGRSSIGRSSSGSFGPAGLGNRGSGRSSVASGLSISATIIDHGEIDRALLAEAARRRGAAVDIYGRPVADAPRLSPAVVGQRANASPRGGWNQLPPKQSHQVVETRARTEHVLAKTYLERAERAEASGEPFPAKLFYQRVVKHGSPAQKKLAEQRLDRIEACLARPH